MSKAQSTAGLGLEVTCIDGRNFTVLVPSSTDGSLRQVHIPISQPEALARILKARAEAVKADQLKLRIGNDAAPTEHMIREWLRADASRRVLEDQAKREAEAEELRTKYGSLFDEIEI